MRLLVVHAVEPSYVNNRDRILIAICTTPAKVFEAIERNQRRNTVGSFITNQIVKTYTAIMKEMLRGEEFLDFEITRPNAYFLYEVSIVEVDK